MEASKSKVFCLFFFGIKLKNYLKKNQHGKLKTQK